MGATRSPWRYDEPRHRARSYPPLRADSRRHCVNTIARPEIVRRQVSVSKTLDRRFKETLGFNIQVEKPIFKEAGQSHAYSGLADTADAGEEYAHVAAFDKSRAISRLGS
jgi:hypothetical protein